MKFFRQQFYFAATISLMLFGIAKTDYVRGIGILSDGGDLIEQGVQDHQAEPIVADSNFAAESRDQESSYEAASETEPPANSIEPVPAVSRQRHADSTSGTIEQVRVDSTHGIKAHKAVYSASPTIEHNRIDRGLYAAITSRIGRPYRSGGTDDNGYDCSGFVWRVFHDAGVDFERGSARTYWQTLPEATKEEKEQFGTLVFFDNTSHVGVVRDAHSFYHASSSQGVTLSNYSGYWGAHVIGYRRVRLSQDVSMVR
jgi:cell wall-associated NlpC family hydrolase